MWHWPVIWIASGIFGWTLLEYELHRYLGHSWNTRLRDRHLKHHDDPEDKTISAIWSGIGVALSFGGSMIAASLMYFIMGCLLGYWNYERIHRQAHSNTVNWPHLTHHHNPIGNFGVTTLWWDRVFGTTL